MTYRRNIFSLLAFGLILTGCENIQKANTAITNAFDTLTDVDWADDVVPQLAGDHTPHNVIHSDASKLLEVKLPENIPSQIKEYSGFTLSFNSSTQTPNWVGWELLASETEGNVSRSNKFWQDEEIEGCPSPADYKNSGFDKGHMCPAADNKVNEEMMYDCFSMANMCPQAPALNQKAWSTLEKKERLWAKRDSAIYIIAGPIYRHNDNGVISGTNIKIPSAYFKVIIAPYVDEPRGIAFVYPNMASPGNMQNYSTTIREVEKITGYDFFHNLPDELEDAIETKTSFKEWNQTN